MRAGLGLDNDVVGRQLEELVEGVLEHGRVRSLVRQGNRRASQVLDLDRDAHSLAESLGDLVEGRVTRIPAATFERRGDIDARHLI